MKKLWSHLPWIVCLVLVSLLLTRNLWGTRAWIETHDGIFHLIRQEVFTDSLKSGHFPVRWAGSLDNGLGLPIFNYIYPGPYYLGSVLSLIGLSSKWVIKILEIGLYLLGGLGFYALSAKRHQTFALISSILYLTTPYLLLNLFVRGALGEFMAISLIPWALVALQDIRARQTLSWYHPLPYFLLLVSHNFLSFLFLPVYLVLIFLDRTALKTVMKSLIASILLSAFFILPMIFERGLLYSVSTGNFTYSFADHFVYPLQLIYSQWGIGHSYAGTGDGFSFALGFANLAVLFLAFRTLFLEKGREFLAYTWLTVLTILFLLPISLPLWELFSPLQIIQFPWRLLSLTTVIIPLLSFTLLMIYRGHKYLKAIVTILLLTNLAFAFRFSTPFYFQNNDQLATQLYIHRDKTTTSSRAEVLPRWAPLSERWIGIDVIEIKGGSAKIDKHVVLPTSISFTSTTDDSATFYLIHRNYFPSWQAQDEKGDNFVLEPGSTGEIILTPDLGTHNYRVYVGSTWIEQISNWLSLAGFIYLLSLFLRPKLRNLIDEKFKDWDISIALRYLPIALALKKHAKPGDKILEVGSEIRGITTYYKRAVTGLDLGFDYKRQNKYLKPVAGSAIAMPFKDKSFDYVISVDCIEHISPKLRVKAVQEMLRVANKQIYLTFPVGPHSQMIDKMLDGYFYTKNGEHFTYLTEHVDNGLPGFDFIPKIVAGQKGWTLKEVGNTSTWLWVLLLKMGFSNVPWQTSIYRRLLLILPLLKHCNFGQCYRQLYIITRGQS